MASTNKTTNYELSQYIGTDKPTYLGDYNGDMLKIDTAMKNNADSASSASTLATTAKNTADTASANAGTALTNANTAKNTADSALAKATVNESAIANFNLTSFDTITTFNKTGSGTVRTGSQINTAMNSDGSLAKVYGQLTITGVTNPDSNQGIITFNTDLRPESDITIVGGCICANVNSNNVVVTTYLKDFTIKTNGDIEIKYNYTINSGEIWRCMFINSLIFVKDFGDTPIPE